MNDTFLKACVLLGVITAVGGCARALAGDARHDRRVAEARERFVAADIDHDGRLTRSEAASGMPRVAEHFDDIDTAHAGSLTLEQILRYAASRRRGADGG